MALEFISQAAGALGKNSNIKIWGLEGIGRRHDNKKAINLVEGSDINSAATTDSINQKGNKMEGGEWGEIKILGRPFDRKCYSTKGEIPQVVSKLMPTKGQHHKHGVYYLQWLGMEASLEETPI